MAMVAEVQVGQLVIACSANPAQGLSVTSANASVLSALFSNALPEDIVVRAKFHRLAESWRRDTDHLSSAARTVMHPAYQAIIGMGARALPLIFHELKARGGHWFWALMAITEEDPARDCSAFGDALRAWLTWGQDHGYIA